MHLWQEYRTKTLSAYLAGPRVWGCGWAGPFLRGLALGTGAGASSAILFSFLSTCECALTQSACTRKGVAAVQPCPVGWDVLRAQEPK